MKFICPLVVVNDIQKSRHLYETILGQKVKTDFGENVTFYGDFSIHQKAHFSKLINSPISSKSNNFELYFEDDKIVDVVDTLHELNFEFVHDLQEQPWRQFVVRFYDYDFNIIEIGEPMEHVVYRLYCENMSLDKISKITYMPEEAVSEAIKKYSQKV